MRHGWDYILHRGGIVVEETAYSPEYDGNQRFGIFHNPIAAKFNSTNEECQYLNNDKISGMITCTRNTPITLKILIKLQLIVISFLRRQLYTCMARNRECLKCIFDMFYSLISHTYNPNAAHLNLGLELTLDILDFGIELQEILYKEGTPELPDADSFHQRLYTFALGYFAAGTYWHTTTHKFNLENIIADIKSILKSLRSKNKRTKPTQGYTIKLKHTVQTNEYTASTFLFNGNSRLDAAISEHGYGIKTGDAIQIQRKLLTVLLSDEVERLITWNHPNNPKVTSMFAFKD